MKINYRIITDLFPKGIKKYINSAYVALHLRNFLFIFFALMAGVLLQILVILNAKYTEIRREYQVKENTYVYWNSIVSQFPNIPDILYNASLSALSMGKREEAGKFVNKALSIDPLFEEALRLREKIEKY